MNRNDKLINASYVGLITDVQECLDDGADINAVDKYMETPLIKSITSQNRNITKILIEHGADLDKQSSDGFTALMTATVLEDLKTVKMLISAGADINIKRKNFDNSDSSALITALGKNVDLVKALSEAGADTSYLDGSLKEEFEKVSLIIEQENKKNILLDRYKKRSYIKTKSKKL